MLGHVPIPHDLKEFVFHRGCSFNLTSIVNAGLIAGGREGLETRHTVFFIPLDPWCIEEEEEYRRDLTRPRKVHYKTSQKHSQNDAYWTHLGRAHEKSIAFWQTKLHAITTNSTVSLDCIERVISQRGEMNMYQRSATPRPAPRVVQSKAWNEQQQQQEPRETAGGT